MSIDRIASITTESSEEENAETRLGKILADPENAFLTEFDQNRLSIEEAPTYVEALEIVDGLILKRLQHTFKYEVLNEVEGVEVLSVDMLEVRDFLERIKSNQKIIGEGGYAIVVIDKNDIANLPPEVCYKIVKTDVVKEDLNTLTTEAQLQAEAREIVAMSSSKMFDVPPAFYVAEVGHTKVFAMEKLPALSLKDLAEGKGFVPEWLDVDEFCSELQNFIDLLHSQGLYHRDLHWGNLMIRQSEEVPNDGVFGYVIDFGFSGYAQENMGEDPYKKEIGSKTFTYRDDCVIVLEAREALRSLKNNLQ